MEFGILLLPQYPIRQLAKWYQQAEAAGIEYAWVPDEVPSPPFRDPFAVLAAIGHQTSHIKLGTNINVPYTRHPALLAYTMKSLDELYPGRMILGLGPGGVLTLEPLGIPMWDRPLTMLREATLISRFKGSKEYISD